MEVEVVTVGDWLGLLSDAGWALAVVLRAAANALWRPWQILLLVATNPPLKLSLKLQLTGAGQCLSAGCPKQLLLALIVGEEDCLETAVVQSVQVAEVVSELLNHWQQVWVADWEADCQAPAPNPSILCRCLLLPCHRLLSLRNLCITSWACGQRTKVLSAVSMADLQHGAVRLRRGCDSSVKRQQHAVGSFFCFCLFLYLFQL